MTRTHKLKKEFRASAFTPCRCHQRHRDPAGSGLQYRNCQFNDGQFDGYHRRWGTRARTPAGSKFKGLEKLYQMLQENYKVACIPRELISVRGSPRRNQNLKPSSHGCRHQNYNNNMAHNSQNEKLT